MNWKILLLPKDPNDSETLSLRSAEVQAVMRQHFCSWDLPYVCEICRVPRWKNRDAQSSMKSGSAVLKEVTSMIKGEGRIFQTEV